MKNIIYIFSTLLFLSCGNQKEYNTTVIDEEENAPMLINWATIEGLKKEPFISWYTENHDAYQVDNATAESIKPLLKGVKIKAFMGTWCSDSQREIPSFFKIMETIGYNTDNIDLITVNRDKTTLLGLEKDLNIEYVPTLIFYKDSKEINRIVESPIESFEKDMIAILSGKPYKHTYAE